MEVLLGLTVVHDIIWNLICILGKRYLYRCHQNNEKPSIVIFKECVKEVQYIEYQIALKNGKVEQHNKKWKGLNL